MTPDVGIETLHYEFAGTQPLPAFAPVLVGVVGSGQLEVLLEPSAQAHCSVQVQTSARGFGSVWQAVLQAFATQTGLSHAQISINDMGATPAVVSLRLQQALAQAQSQAEGAQP